LWQDADNRVAAENDNGRATVNRQIIFNGGTTRRSGFTWPEFIVSLIVVGVVVGLVIPMILESRVRARRLTCTNQLKMIGLALHNYAQANRVFPPGTICASAPIQPSNQYDVWAEAGQAGAGFHGTGFLVRTRNYMSTEDVWLNSSHGICSTAQAGGIFGITNFQYASSDIKYLYCPTRRNGLRPSDASMMLSTTWTGGGTDYGGCVGRHAAFTLQTGYNLCDGTMYYEPNFFPSPLKSQADDTPAKRWGIFGRVNVSTKFSDISDGLSCTIMTGELQRITTISPTSKDGWVIGGPATLFTTGAMMSFDGKTVANVAPPTAGALMNNMFWGSPGSDHPGGANYGMADGSVRFLPTSIDPSVFALLGSMADGVAVDPDK
jgi:prepilin-type processing-associated H-X9-DG protein